MIRKQLKIEDLRQRSLNIKDFILKLFQNGCLYFPYYTLHTPKHFQNIENSLARIIPSHVAKSFNQYEIFFLLNSVWLHDVGMIIKKDEDQNDDVIREEHHLRTERFIWEEPRLQLDDIEKTIISKICKFHRSKERYFELDEIIPVHHDRVRVKFLAALLRLADACDIDFTRAPSELYRILKDTMPEQSEIHWLRHQLVTGVDFWHDEGKILISFFLHDKDYDIIANLIIKEINEELEFLNKTSLFKNRIIFNSVEPMINYDKNREVNPQLYKAVLVTKTMQPQPPSAGQVTELLAKLILKEDEETKNTTKFLENVRMILELITNLRPNIFSTKKFRRELVNIINEIKYEKIDEARKKITEFARKYINYRTDAIKKIGELGASIISDGDIIMQCGYSEPVFSALRIAAKRGKKDITILSPEMRPRTQTDEGYQVALEARRLGIKSVFFLDAATAFFMPRTSKILMGCKGIAKDGSVINATGALNIATVAKYFGVPLYILAETSKITNAFGETEHRPVEEILDKQKIKKLEKNGITPMNPASDIIPAEFITEIITELGKCKPQEIEINYFVNELQTTQ